MGESLAALRLQNARMTRALASAAARRTVRRVRAELAHRGLSAMQRERIVQDSLLTMAACKQEGADPIEVLLGAGDVSSYDDNVAAFCASVADACPRTPVALVVIRFFALMLVACAAVFTGHLAYRCVSAPPGGWLPFPLVNLRTTDAFVFALTCVLMPVLFAAATAVSCAVRRNPAPHVAPVVAAPALFAAVLLVLNATTRLFAPMGTWHIDVESPLAPSGIGEAMARGMASEAWINVDRLALAFGILVLAAVGLGVAYAIERRDPRA